MKYEKPIMEVLELLTRDVITTSPDLELDDDYTGEGGFAPKP